MFKCPIGWWLWRGEVVSSWRLFLIIQLFFSPGCDGAWVPPSVPIKAVFLQRNLNWWRQPLRSLEVKSHRTCTADGLCRRRWKEREKDGNKQALKWQPVSSKELRFSTQFETFHFQIPNFSLKLLSNLQETGETTISCFWRISATIPHENYSHFKYFSKNKRGLGAAWSSALTRSPIWIQTSLPAAFFRTKAETAESQDTGDSA